MPLPVLVERKPDTPVVTARGLLARVLDAGDGISEQYMFGLVVHRLNSDLEFSLFPDNFLSLFHVDPGKFDTDIPGNIVHPGQDLDFGILCAE